MRTNLLLVAIATIVHVVATPTTAIPGGWFKIKNIADPHIQELGKWAVLEHTQLGGNDGLRFVKVVSSEEQIVNGVNYRLVIDALRLDGSHGTYKAVLFEKDSSNPKTRKFISFTPAN
ncbi:putative cysteine proteinase inhibitor 7 [Triticum dicoccoides]|uniref:putative cysteine proteinase inhibitor 7 n=1 Tax=Triticum dicoccoides TaxID=85692 RepID=UPI00189188EB|nr:putative cysteine proteinase inhibitor 7 [Triticum dicoccoides]